MKHKDALVLQRTAEIVAAIRPLPPDVRPSPQFVRKTRQRLLDQILPTSLTVRRRRQTLPQTALSSNTKRSA